MTNGSQIICCKNTLKKILTTNKFCLGNNINHQLKKPEIKKRITKKIIESNHLQIELNQIYPNHLKEATKNSYCSNHSFKTTINASNLITKGNSTLSTLPIFINFYKPKPIAFLNLTSLSPTN